MDLPAGITPLVVAAICCFLIHVYPYLKRQDRRLTNPIILNESVSTFTNAMFFCHIPDCLQWQLSQKKVKVPC